MEASGMHNRLNKVFVFEHGEREGRSGGERERKGER